MTWAKLDDGFWGHPKIIAAGNEAVGTYCRGLSYCGSQLTDGFIPADVARFLAGRRQPIKRLVDVGLWAEVDGGFEIHDFLEFNPSRAQKEEEQERKSRGGRRGGLASRQARRQAQAEAYASPRAEAEALANAGEGASAAAEPRPVPVPSRPVVEKETDVSLSTSRLSNLLADLIAENDPNGKRPTVTQRWADAERLLIERDGRKPDEVEWLIRWVVADDFESANVLSMTKLRSRYSGLWQKATRTRQSSAQKRANAVDERIKAGLEGRIG